MKTFADKQKAKGLHYCELLNGKNGGYGSAVDYCYEPEGIKQFEAQDKQLRGELWVSNSEYESQVNFCPVCGQEAKIKIRTIIAGD